MRGCFVHLLRSMVRNVYEKGNKILYDSDAAFRLEINMILALAFVPVKNVGVVMDELRMKFEGSNYANQLEPMLDYFEDSTPIGAGKRKMLGILQKHGMCELWSRQMILRQTMGLNHSMDKDQNYGCTSSDSLEAD